MAILLYKSASRKSALTYLLQNREVIASGATPDGNNVIFWSRSKGRSVTESWRLHVNGPLCWHKVWEELVQAL